MQEDCITVGRDASIVLDFDEGPNQFAGGAQASKLGGIVCKMLIKYMVLEGYGMGRGKKR